MGMRHDDDDDDDEGWTTRAALHVSKQGKRST
jgi:hypothetical protein